MGCHLGRRRAGGSGRGNQCHGGEVEHALGLDDLAVLEGEPIALEGPEGLLDAPAQPVELDDLFGLGGIGHGMGGHEAPEKRCFPGGGIDLAGFHLAKVEGFGEVFHETIVRPGNLDPFGPQLDDCSAALLARPTGRYPHLAGAQARSVAKSVEQLRAIGQVAVRGGPHDQDREPAGLRAKSA